MAHHILLEIRTGRDSAQTAQSSAQLLSSLPALKNNLLNRLKSGSERFSLELVLENQSIYFATYRLV